jgi:hypothetical protein
VLEGRADAADDEIDGLPAKIRRRGRCGDHQCQIIARAAELYGNIEAA